MAIADVIDTFQTHADLQVKRIGNGTLLDGQYTAGDPTYFRINASIRPESGATLQNEAEGEHETETRTLYTKTLELWPQTRQHEADLVLLEGVAAELDLGDVTDNADSVIEAVYDGEDGNELTLELVAGAVGSAGVLDESAAPAIVFTFLTGVTTVLAMETAIAAGTLLAVKTAGTPGNVLVAVDDETGAVSLAGGSSETWRVANTKRYRTFWKSTIERLDRP